MKSPKMKLQRIFKVIISLCFIISVFSLMKRPQGRNTSLRLELFNSNVEQSVNFYTQILNFSYEGDAINPLYQQVTM
ncbi:hypothetical protein SAMN04488514_107204 [Kriegella aquimaris]|uniref:Uncharacterized protein n=1 Tax=Kriegella aquimaris TaxID=192904 RepID=A0A1G9SBE7_9FLAO|nr:hypothetical protein SAMN04488514_107204 [Kriegella aquimaris]